MSVRGSTLGLVLLLHASAAAGQTLRASTDMGRVERGQSVRVTLSVTTETPLTDATVHLRLPRGFMLRDSLGTPTMASTRRESLILPGTTSFDYDAFAPMFTSPFRRTRAPGDSVDFKFDVTYKTLDTQKRGEASVRVFYTTAKGIYYLSGIIGVLLGYLVKNLRAPRGPADGVERDSLSALRRTFSLNLPNMVVALLIGAVGLLFLAREAVPALNWNQALVLGIGLGLLGDETLLEKVRGSVVH
jgi:hypothetical protein